MPHALPISSSLTYHSNYNGWRVQVMKLLIMQFPSVSLYSKYSPQHLFWNTLSLCSSLNVRDGVSHPYRTSGKIIVLYILIFMFLDRREDKRFWTEWWQALPKFNPLNFFLNQVLICYRATFSQHLLPILMSWFCPAFWWWDSSIYLVFTVFTSRWTSLLA
jgi:hypothetical protein